MTRDIADRLHLYGATVRIERIALNPVQVAEYQPPPNPAKRTDKRYKKYAAAHGTQSWELDALEPLILDGLIKSHVHNYLDSQAFEKARQRQEKEREQILALYAG